MRFIILVFFLSMSCLTFGTTIKGEHAKQLKDEEDYVGDGVVLLSGIHTFFRCAYANDHYSLVRELSKTNSVNTVTAAYFGDILGLHTNGFIYRLGYPKFDVGYIGSINPKRENKYTKIPNGYSSDREVISELDITDNVYLLFEKNLRINYISVSGCVNLLPVNDVYKKNKSELKNYRGKILEFKINSKLDFPKKYFKD